MKRVLDVSFLGFTIGSVGSRPTWCPGIPSLSRSICDIAAAAVGYIEYCDWSPLEKLIKQQIWFNIIVKICKISLLNYLIR